MTIEQAITLSEAVGTIADANAKVIEVCNETDYHIASAISRYSQMITDGIQGLHEIVKEQTEKLNP